MDAARLALVARAAFADGAQYDNVENRIAREFPGLDFKTRMDVVALAYADAIGDDS
jgi:hypothetical protein